MAAPQPGETGKDVLILYATMTGNARDAVEMLVHQLDQQGLRARVMEMREFNPLTLATQSRVLFLTSTFGNGDPPDSAYTFWDVLQRADRLDLSKMKFSVLALGDSAYPRFCKFGENLDARLEKLGATRIAPLQKCDVDWEAPATEWCRTAAQSLGS